MNQQKLTFWTRVVIRNESKLFIVKANTENEFKNKVRSKVAETNPVDAHSLTFKYTSNSGPFNPGYPKSTPQEMIDKLWDNATVID